MKKLYFSSLCICLSAWSFGQIVNIPDANFKSRLINTNCAQLPSPAWPTDVDTNNDGEIQVSEAANVLTLDVSTNEFNSVGNIISLDGLASFTNLTELNCKGNAIANLDVAPFANLAKLDCSYNQLTNIDASGLANLTELRCMKNQLTQMNVFGMTNLRLIYCIYNNLTQVDLSGLTALESFQCDVNQISNLIMGNNVALQSLSVSQNLLTTIDLQSAPNLMVLWASNNAITTLNFNGLNSLDSVEIAANQLTTIDASQAPLLNRLNCAGNPNLTSINVRNSHLSSGDPDLLDFPFRFDDLPNLASICMDDGEQNYLLATLYNSNPGVLLFGGPNCDIPLEINANGTSDFDMKNAVVLYPNPATNTININVASGVSLQSVSIYNTLGQLVKTLDDTDLNALLPLDVSVLKTGTYFMKINSNNGKTTKKFVKI
jgi:hypothetical protein